MATFEDCQKQLHVSGVRIWQGYCMDRSTKKSYCSISLHVRYMCNEDSRLLAGIIWKRTGIQQVWHQRTWVAEAYRRETGAAKWGHSAQHVPLGTRFMVLGLSHHSFIAFSTTGHNMSLLPNINGTSLSMWKHHSKIKTLSFSFRISTFVLWKLLTP